MLYKLISSSSSGGSCCYCSVYNVICQVVVVSRSTRRSPLTRQPVLTHLHRRHVIIGKSTSFPLHDIVSDTARQPQTNSSDTRGRRRHSASHADRTACDGDSGDESDDDDDDDDDDDALWLENTHPSATATAQQTDAIFIPGRLLGTSDSFCIRSRPMTDDECGHTLPTTAADDGDSQHAADGGNNASQTDSQHCATLADSDTFDDVTSSSSPAFVRETRIRRRPNIRRQRITADRASD